MKRIIIGALCIAGAAILAASCGNSKKKAAEQEAAEQARLDSLEQVEQEKRQKEAMETIAALPDEPVFNINTNHAQAS